MRDPAWTDLHDLALVYLVLLYSAPPEAQERSPDRPGLPPQLLKDAHRRLTQLYPQIGEERLHRVFREAFLMHVGVAGAPMLEVAVASLRRTLPRRRRLAVLDDLAGLAADGAGDLQSSGLSFIQYLAVRWDLGPNPERGE